MSIILPKKALSYSAIDLWNTNKTGFRKHYYENIQLPDTKYTLFGREAEKKIEQGQYPNIPFFGNPQHKLKTEIENIPIVGYLDSFDKNKNRFIDFKSSKNKWTKSVRLP